MKTYWKANLGVWVCVGALVGCGPQLEEGASFPQAVVEEAPEVVHSTVSVVEFVEQPMDGLPTPSSDESCDGDSANEEMTNEDVANEDVTNEDVTNEDVADEDVANEDVANEDVANEDEQPQTPMIRFSVDIQPEDGFCGGADAVKQTSDGGYIVAGCKDDRAWLAKLDAYGAKEWDNTYNLMDYWGNKQVIQTSDGGYLFAGWVGIVKVDANGQKEWINKSKPAGMGPYPYYEDIIEHSNGKYYAVGGPNNGQAVLVRLSRDGKVQSRKWYGGNCDDDKFRSITEAPDGNLIMVGAKTHGNSQYACSFEWYNDVWVVKVRPGGVKVWEKTFGGIYYEEAHDIVRLENGYGIIGEKCAGTPATCGNKNSVFYVEIDNHGNKVKSKVFQKNGHSAGYSITTTQSGGVAWLGEKGNSGSWVYKSGQNEQTANAFPAGAGGRSIERTSDGGFIIGTWGGRLIKTDANFSIEAQDE